jgi:flagellin-like protein
MKMLKSKKALSPVVASIILIAVTVAVSIAVAAWMGALTFTFMKTEELKVQSHTWAANRTSISITVKTLAQEQ